MWDIIAVDISGRHRIKGGYYMVCAAVALTVSANHIEKVKQIKIQPLWLKRAPSLLDIVQLIEDTADQLSFEGTIVAEKGDMYNKPIWVLGKHVFESLQMSGVHCGEKGNRTCAPYFFERPQLTN